MIFNTVPNGYFLWITLHTVINLWPLKYCQLRGNISSRLCRHFESYYYLFSRQLKEYHWKISRKQSKPICMSSLCTSKEPTRSHNASISIKRFSAPVYVSMARCLPGDILIDSDKKLLDWLNNLSHISTRYFL